MGSGELFFGMLTTRLPRFVVNVNIISCLMRGHTFRTNSRFFDAILLFSQFRMIPSGRSGPAPVANLEIRKPMPHVRASAHFPGRSAVRRGISPMHPRKYYTSSRFHTRIYTSNAGKVRLSFFDFRFSFPPEFPLFKKFEQKSRKYS